MVPLSSIVGLNQFDHHLPTCVDGTTALHYGGFCGDLDVVDLLLSNGGQCDVVDADGRVALHWATRNPRFPVFERILALVCLILVLLCLSVMSQPLFL